MPNHNSCWTPATAYAILGVFSIMLLMSGCLVIGFSLAHTEIANELAQLDPEKWRTFFEVHHHSGIMFAGPALLILSLPLLIAAFELGIHAYGKARIASHTFRNTQRRLHHQQQQQGRASTSAWRPVVDLTLPYIYHHSLAAGHVGPCCPQQCLSAVQQHEVDRLGCSNQVAAAAGISTTVLDYSPPPPYSAVAPPAPAAVEAAAHHDGLIVSSDDLGQGAPVLADAADHGDEQRNGGGGGALEQPDQASPNGNMLARGNVLAKDEPMG